MKLSSAAFLLALAAALPAAGQARDEARPRDLQRLQEDARNLDDELQALEPEDPKADEFRQRAEEIREEAVYLKVRMRRHQRGGQAGTGIEYQEVDDLRRQIADLRSDIERSFSALDRGPRELVLPEGTRLLVRLDAGLSSRTARREDRFDASVHRPVRAGGVLAIPAGTRVRGIVRAVEPAERPSKGGHLELDFDSLYLERSRLDMHTRVASVDEDDGRDNAGKAGIGAVVGGVLGGILGGRKGAIVGVILGGTGAVVASKGEEVELPAGTVLTVSLLRPLVLPRE